MTSGEVLFILAFIVLPTAILVSSIWAVVFVWRRPDRVVPEHSAEPVTVLEHETTGIEDTALLEVIEREPDVVSPVEEPVAASVSEPSDELEPEPEVAASPPVSADEPAAIDLPQPTEDLDEIVARITELETVVNPRDEETVIEELAVEPDTPTPPAAPEDEPAFTQTSELPVVEPPAHAAEPDMPAPEPAPTPQPAPAADRQEPESGWRRRRRDVKLRPADSEAPRKRGRNRDLDRQVPQLGRSARRRESAQRSTPPDHDQESAPGNR